MQNPSLLSPDVRFHLKRTFIRLYIGKIERLLSANCRQSPCKEKPRRSGVGYWRSTELLGGIPAADYSQIADHLNRVFYTTIVTNYAADFSVA